MFCFSTKKMKISVAIVVVLFLLIRQNEAFTCRPCVHERDCRNQITSEAECTYGIVTDACDCCKVCAKGPGERCGGRFHVGKCGKGMTCTTVITTPTSRPSITPRPITTLPPHLLGPKCVVHDTTITTRP